jgi:hypothetical protein
LSWEMDTCCTWSCLSYFALWLSTFSALSIWVSFLVHH